MTDLIKHSGQVFTPDYLVINILDEAGYNSTNILRKHCIDNSCGDGAFLCEIVRRYLKAYYMEHNSYDNVQNELKEFIHGIELDNDAYECCKDNLCSVFSEFDLTDCEIDLQHGDTLKIHDYDGRMDYVVGNPPYVRVHNLEENFEEVKTFSFANGGMTDLYLVFFEIGFNMLKRGGKLCYITPSSWINSVAGATLRTYIRVYRNLISLIDLGHYQAFKATTYTMISLFQKGISHNSFEYYEYNTGTLNKQFICEISFDKVSINGYFYLADNATLQTLRSIMTTPSLQYVSVKNGFATLADKVFISSDLPFDKFVIPVLKASTGKWYTAFYPYDEHGKPLSKDTIFSNQDVAKYLELHKKELLKDTQETTNAEWYLYGRTQALKDVYSYKIGINTTIKDINSLKLNEIPAGCGIYSGLYILSRVPLKNISKILMSEEFIKYIASLKKYKSGGYYTFNSKDLELFLNYKISKQIEDEEISVKPINKCGFLESHNNLFQGFFR